MQLILAVGASGSGKTWWSKAYCDNHANIVRLSTDELRGIVGYGEEDQTVSHKVFQMVEAMTEYFLKNGKSVLIDATNYSIKNRKAFIFLGKKYKASICAYILNKCSLEELKRRNHNRERCVPDDIIERQYNNLVIPTKNEVDFIAFETETEGGIHKWKRP